MAIGTEYFIEGDLKTYLKSFNESSLPTSEKQAKLVDIFHRILKGIALMEERKILHGDLKDTNIFIKDGLPKIGNFVFSVDRKKPGAKRKGGSLIYMSPESYLYLFQKTIKRQSLALINKDEREAINKIFNSDEFKSYNEETALSCKNDTWSYAIMLFQSMNENFFEPNSYCDLADMMHNISQREIDDKIFMKNAADDYEKNMHKFLKQILIKDPTMRPTPKEAYKIYCEIFNIPAHNFDEEKLN